MKSPLNEELSRLPVLDASGLLHRCLDNVALRSRILKKFCRSLDEQLVSLQRALVEGERETIQPMAHKLRGEAANIGAEQLAALLHEIEANEALRVDEMNASLRQARSRLLQAVRHCEEVVEDERPRLVGAAR